MKVKELIEKLQEYDPERDVVIDRDSEGWHTIDCVRQVPGEDEDLLVSIDIAH